MTITISQQAYEDLFGETVEHSQHPDPDDPLDVVYKYPRQLAQGYWRRIYLRQGLELEIGSIQMHDRLLITYPEQEHPWLEYHFHFSGEHEDKYTSISGGQYIFSGSGLEPKKTVDDSDRQPYLELIIFMQPDLLYSFAGDRDGQLASELQQWIRQPHQRCYYHCKTATLAMQTVARQILQCPYRGVAKRLYLEAKALELMAMLVGQELEIQDKKSSPHLFKPDVIERIHHARDILLKRLHNPPSLIELARAVGLNDYLLKLGFRHCFGTTVFSYLHCYRLEQARQLLETGEMKVSEIADLVGFRSQSYFAAAFRTKFGLCPKQYQMQHKKSV
ncbi:helix-turn-helix transcriptional regulator [Chroococcidiopsis thermalis]|uniref:Transcriptional regulator, AraC family n=1 Tax=Chroococcidiopsis thermalis (strain PCC 7203) TaxID=251229 RepID=K9U6S8_CHRTP|nr:AraC family transcriptional regulator [Chroococcidiopsis thermalis]AFY90545.1 transcriptional regulator, AraC family [Chroococcidiopsis thermalis PCC 7203]